MLEMILLYAALYFVIGMAFLWWIEKDNIYHAIECIIETDKELSEQMQMVSEDERQRYIKSTVMTVRIATVLIWPWALAVEVKSWLNNRGKSNDE